MHCIFVMAFYNSYGYELYVWINRRQREKKKTERNCNLYVLSSNLYYGGHLILPGQQMSFGHQHSSLEVRN